MPRSEFPESFSKFSAASSLLLYEIRGCDTPPSDTPFRSSRGVEALNYSTSEQICVANVCICQIKTECSRNYMYTVIQTLGLMMVGWWGQWARARSWGQLLCRSLSDYWHSATRCKYPMTTSWPLQQQQQQRFVISPPPCPTTLWAFLWPFALKKSHHCDEWSTMKKW